jgi:hypothetical protein
MMMMMGVKEALEVLHLLLILKLLPMFMMDHIHFDEGFLFFFSRSSHNSFTITFISRNIFLNSLSASERPSSCSISFLQNTHPISGLNSSSVPSPRLDLDLISIHLQTPVKPGFDTKLIQKSLQVESEFYLIDMIFALNVTWGEFSQRFWAVSLLW